MQKFIENLQTLGLRKREIQVLTALHIFGRLSVTKIGLRSKLPRTTVDAILRRLQSRGFVRQVQVGKHLEWKATDLTKVQSRTNAAFDAIQHELDPKILGPVLESIDAKDIGIQVFRGKQQIHEAYLAFHAQKRQRVQVIQGSEFGIWYLKNIFERPEEISAIEAGKQSGIILEGITTEEGLNIGHILDEAYIKKSLERPMIMHIVPEEILQFSAEIALFNKEVFISLPREQMVIIIEHPEITNTFKSLWHVLAMVGRKIDIYEYFRKIVAKNNAKQRSETD